MKGIAAISTSTPIVFDQSEPARPMCRYFCAKVGM